MNLGKPENEEEMEKNGGKEIGFFEHDFGIWEWEWPQGVGLDGMFKIMKSEQSDTYMEFLHK